MSLPSYEPNRVLGGRASSLQKYLRKLTPPPPPPTRLQPPPTRPQPPPTRPQPPPPTRPQPPPPPAPRKIPRQPRVQSFKTALIARRKRQNEKQSKLYKVPFPYQTAGRNSNQLPCLDLTALELAPQTSEVLTQSQVVVAGDGQYRVKANCWKTKTDVQSVQFNWLELPQGYRGVQCGTFSQETTIRSATVEAQKRAYRVSFPTPFKSQPKVAVFLGQFYVSNGRDYRFMVHAKNVDRSGFTLIIQSSGANPNVMTNFNVNWIAHRASSRSVESGTFEKVFRSESSGAGKITFRHKNWTRKPVVFMGISLLEIRKQNQLKIGLTSRSTNRRGVRWRFDLGSVCEAGAAIGQYIVIA
ncbi:hypothetical protein EIP86_002706 [Pleurotus ostreatoroseus]|nr:hypothetical protein EIP86_002706 [Pleurotus ostreatoroseus]